MSLEFRDGHFEGPMPVEEALAKFRSAIDEGEDVKALHVGTKEELEDKAKISDEIKRLNAQIEALQANARIRDEGLLKIPTYEEIEAYKNGVK